MRPLTVTGQSLRLRPEVKDLLRAARDLPVVISTGHANGAEVRLLVDEAVRLDLPRLMLNQPASPLTGLDHQSLREIATIEKVWIEQTALTYILGYQGWEDFAKVLSELPQTIYSSDLGQPSQMDIGDWLRTSQEWFTAAGLTNERILKITRDEPLRMLSI